MLHRCILSPHETSHLTNLYRGTTIEDDSPHGQLPESIACLQIE